MWDWIYWISELFIKLHKMFDPLTTLEKTKGRDKCITLKEANQQRYMPLAAYLYLCLMLGFDQESYFINGWKQGIFISLVVQDDELQPRSLCSIDERLPHMHFRAGQMVSTKGQRRNGLRHKLKNVNININISTKLYFGLKMANLVATKKWNNRWDQL